MKLLCRMAIVAAMFAFGTLGIHADGNHLTWTRNSAPTETSITGGGWTLEQSGAAVGLKSAGYCDSKGNQIGNPGTERMQPYYFPLVSGHGRGDHRAPRLFSLASATLLQKRLLSLVDALTIIEQIYRVGKFVDVRNRAFI